MRIKLCGIPLKASESLAVLISVLPDDYTSALYASKGGFRMCTSENPFKLQSRGSVTSLTLY